MASTLSPFEVAMPSLVSRSPIDGLGRDVPARRRCSAGVGFFPALADSAAPFVGPASLASFEERNGQRRGLTGGTGFLLVPAFFVLSASECGCCVCACAPLLLACGGGGSNFTRACSGGGTPVLDVRRGGGGGGGHLWAGRPRSSPGDPSRWCTSALRRSPGSGHLWAGRPRSSPGDPSRRCTSAPRRSPGSGHLWAGRPRSSPGDPSCPCTTAPRRFPGSSDM